MQFAKVSLGAALDAAQDRREYTPLSELEENLEQYLREAKAIVRSQLAASLASRGLPAERNVPPPSQVESNARGLLLGLVAPAEQAALAKLLYGRS